MAFSEAFTQDDLSVSTTELSLTGGTSTIQTRTDDGVYQLFLDTANTAKADEFKIRLYEKPLSGSTQRLVETWTIMGDQGDKVFYTPQYILMHGWDFTIQRTAGADRTFDASIRKVS